MSTPKYRWRVDIIESERGFGQKVDDTKFFDSEGEANKFVTEYNRQNNKKEVPDWYMYATTPKKIRVA